MTPPPTTIQSKIVCFMHRDWLDFDDTLLELFPNALYFRERVPREKVQTPEPPKIDLHHRLVDTTPNWQDRVYMVFNSGFRPKFWQPSVEVGLKPENWYWSLRAPQYPFVQFTFGGHVFDSPVPHPTRGEIHFYATPGDKIHAALAGKFYRAFRKHAVNWQGLVWVRIPELTVTAPIPKGAMDWCGYHAVEWASQNPKRVLHLAQGLGIRPADTLG